MFAFADPQRVSQVLTAAGRGLEEAVVQSTQIGAVNSWLRGQPAEVVAAAIAAIREALATHVDGASVRLPGAAWLVSFLPERALLGSRIYRAKEVLIMVSPGAGFRGGRATCSAYSAGMFTFARRQGWQ